MSERIIGGGKYTLERQIGQGGMGTIWVAHDPMLQRRVALKLMTPDYLASPLARNQFTHEARVIAQMRNPHVVQIFDYGIDGDTPYIVMELLDGEDLGDRLRREGRLSLAALSHLLGQISRGLSPAHSAGIVHRDLKPANLFISRVDSEEILKVLDFGLAGPAGAGGAGPQGWNASLIGTPRYMSPEQVRQSPDVDHRSDLWSLAVILYQALTGQAPFTADTIGELMVRICTEAVAPPSRLVAGLGPEVDKFFERALARDPVRRFQSAREMAAAFAALVDTGQANKPIKILVVDDEPDVAVLMQQRFRRQLRDSVYQFVFASDGESALDLLRRHPDIEIALTDINMPVMDGLSFLARVGEVNPLVKVIIVSAYSDMNNIRVAMNRGAFDFLVKPIDFQDLEATLSKTIKHVRELRRTVHYTEENSLLRMFVGSGIVERLLPAIRSAAGVINEMVEATVAFVDVKDFTSVTRQQHPDVVVKWLNANFEVIVPELTAQGGVVDKFLGDAVMAVFRGSEHAARAVRACLAARRQLELMAERDGKPSPYTLGVCIGLDSGPMVSGSIGSRAIGRLDYTVLGDVVNTAAHLTASAGRNQVLVSEALRDKLGEGFEFEATGSRQIPGKEKPLVTYNVLDSRQKDVTPSDVTSSVLVPMQVA